MKRVNVTSWQDCEAITRKTSQLLEAMMKYQKHSWPPETQGDGCLSGDQNLMIAAIELRDRLYQLITRSREANEPRI